MTVKQFFKSTAFKSLAVLLAIVIIAGALLAIFNDLLYVSAEERRNRDFAKIYGGDIETVSSTLQADKENEGSFIPVVINGNTVTESWLMSDGSYAIQTIGTGGYKEGTITVWTIIDVKADKTWGIRLVKYSSDDKQSYIGRFVSADYEQFANHNSELLEGKMFDEGIDVIKTGASAPFTLGALTNAVNCAITYFKQAVLGETEADLYVYQSWVDLDSTVITPDLDENSVTYQLVMKKNGPVPSFTANITVTGGKISAFSVPEEDAFASDDDYANKVDETIRDFSFFIGMSKEDILTYVLEDGSKLPKDSGALEDLDLSTGATYSTECFLYAAAFALCNFETCLYVTYYDDWFTETSVTVEDTSVSYVLVVKKNGPVPSFTAKITVTDGKISAFSVPEEDAFASDDDYANKVDETIRNFSFFIGMSKEDILTYVLEDGSKLPKDSGALEDLDLSTGATYSTECFLYAAAYALVNNQVFLAKGGNEA